MERGVFLASSILDSSQMVNCLQVLLSAHPTIQFTSVNFDKELHGYRIYFSSETTILGRNYLTTANQPFWIYPMSAFLIISGVSRNSNHAYRKALREAIGKRFGKLLNVKRYIFKKSSSTEKWVVLIDIPEFKGMDAFHRESFSEMIISLEQWNAKLTVEFWCRCCKKPGHFQHECESHSGASAENQTTANGNMTNSKKSEIQSIENIQTHSDSKSFVKNLEKPSGECSKFSLVSTETYAEMIGREEIMKAEISEGENQNFQQINTNESTSSAMNTLLTNKDIQEELRVDEIHSEIKEEKNVQNIKRDKSEEGDSRSLKVPKEEPGTTFNEDNSNYFDESDDEIQFIDYFNKSNPVNTSSHVSKFIAKDEMAISEVVSRSSTNFTCTDHSSSSFSATPGPSNRTPSSTRNSTGVKTTSFLSERLQDCINEVCDTCNVLDRKKLDAFLTHVKKKCSPIPVALIYTKDTKGLKEQLQKILFMYYNTPQTGTKEDIQFIKWLNGLVGRFDGTTPRKRKSSDQNCEKTSTKKVICCVSWPYSTTKLKN